MFDLTGKGFEPQTCGANGDVFLIEVRPTPRVVLQKHFLIVTRLYGQGKFFHSANLLTLNTSVCIKNRLSRSFIGDNKIYYKSDIGNR